MTVSPRSTDHHPSVSLIWVQQVFSGTLHPSTAAELTNPSVVKFCDCDVSLPVILKLTGSAVTVKMYTEKFKTGILKGVSPKLLYHCCYSSEMITSGHLSL